MWLALYFCEKALHDSDLSHAEPTVSRRSSAKWSPTLVLANLFWGQLQDCFLSGPLRCLSHSPPCPIGWPQPAFPELNLELLNTWVSPSSPLLLLSSLLDCELQNVRTGFVLSTSISLACSPVICTKKGLEYICLNEWMEWISFIYTDISLLNAWPQKVCDLLWPRQWKELEKLTWLYPIPVSLCYPYLYLYKVVFFLKDTQWTNWKRSILESLTKVLN